MKLITGLLFVISIFLAPSAAHALDDAEIQAIIAAETPDIVAEFGISKEEAVTYLESAVKAAIAKQAAEQDGTEVSALYADMLEKYSQVLLLGASVVVQGERLYENKIRDAVPGTPVPPELVKEIRQWASQAGMVIRLGTEAGGTAVNYATRSFLEDAKCRLGTPTFQVDDCLARLDKSLGLIEAVMDHMEAMTKAIGVLQLAVVERMTF